MLLVFLFCPLTVWAGTAALNSLVPPAGQILHGVFPGGQPGATEISPVDVDQYEQAVGHKVAWVYFDNDWYRSRVFPASMAGWIRARAATPYIRLMLRSSAAQNRREPYFTLQAIAAGDFDADLAAWGRAAAQFNTPVIVEFGTEMNGDWFSWNARWNGRKRGAERFVAAYRHIINVIRSNGADNIVWVFHVNNSDYPDRRWNRFEAYYPGDGYIDLLAVSIYSTQSPYDRSHTDFRASMDEVMARFSQMAPQKPAIIAELGTDVRNPRENAAQWADGAFRDMLSGRWPALVGFSWWNETWENDSNHDNDTDFRVQSNTDLAHVFHQHLSNPKVQNHR
ncbi:MAG: glycosyl hydrolase [Paracoccaceae bacterium]